MKWNLLSVKSKINSRFFKRFSNSRFYIPRSFKYNEDSDLHKEVIQKFPFATLIIMQNNIPYISHIPLMYDENDFALRGHISRGNPAARLNLNSEYNCIASFQGPDGYISPNWYKSKHLTHKEVPTWNYIVIHVHGKLVYHYDNEWIFQNLNKLTNFHETKNNLNWKVTDSPRAYIDSQIRAVIGVEILISKIEGKFKLSQNKLIDDIKGVVQGLNDSPFDKKELAEWTSRINMLDSKSRE